MATTHDNPLVTVRMATHADCGAIKDIISNHWNGLDTFLYTFHQRLSMDTCFHVVAEINGHVAGYGCGRVIDDGEGIIYEQVRIAEEHQGKGIIHKVHIMLFSTALAKFPNIRRTMWTSANMTTSIHAMRKNPALKLLDVRPFFRFKANTTELYAFCESEAVRVITEQYACKSVIALPKYEALQLLTEDIRFLDFSPKTLLVQLQPCGWHRSTLSDQLRSSNLHISRCPETHKLSAFSFSTAVDSDKSLRYLIDLYCKPQASNISLVIAHLMYHLRDLAAMYMNRTVYINYHFNSQFNGIQLKRFVWDNLGSYLVEGDKRTSLLFEEDMKAMIIPKNKL